MLMDASLQPLRLADTSYKDYPTWQRPTRMFRWMPKWVRQQPGLGPEHCASRRGMGRSTGQRRMRKHGSTPTLAAESTH